MRSLKAIGWFALGAVSILALAAIGYFTGHLAVFPNPGHQVELLSIFLGAATLAVTEVAGFVWTGFRL